MKLYIKPGACSMAAHILSYEIGQPVTVEKVDTKAGRTASGADYSAINPRGYVPVLELESGERLTEASVVCEYIADRAPEKKLMAPYGSMERYRQLEWFNYLSTELHKGCMGQLFNPNHDAETKKRFVAGLTKQLRYLEGHFAKHQYLGDTFSAPDAYAFVILGWTKYVGVDLSPYPAISAYLARIGERPSVAAAQKAEA